MWDDKAMMLMIGVLQALWGVLILLLGVMWKRIADDIRDNTVAIATLTQSLAALNIEALTLFAKGEDLERVRVRVHELTNTVAVLQERIRTRKSDGFGAE